jgi:Predicted hydrocarbon binding protein (contains V4R domain)
MEFLKSWTNNLVDTLEKELDKDSSEKIIENCGCICANECGATKEVGEIVKSLGNTVSVDSIGHKMNEAGIGGGKLRKDGNVIIRVYEQCYCSSRKHIKSNIYCRCTQGRVKEVFERALERKVDVALEKSIAWGDEICKFIVTY